MSEIWIEKVMAKNRVEGVKGGGTGRIKFVRGKMLRLVPPAT